VFLSVLVSYGQFVYFCVFSVFSAVCFELSVPVQVIAWKGAYENASTEKSSTGGGIIKYGKIKYDCARMENASTEKASTNVQRRKV